MILSDLAIKRPTIAIVFSLLLIVFGLVSFSRTPLRQYPDIDPPIVSINTDYPGAAADIVDIRVTRVLEEQLSGLESIKYVSSTSREGGSQITIEFEISRDVDLAVNEVQQSIGRILDRLPEEVEAPRVAKTDSNARAIMWFNLTSDDLDGLELTDIARRQIIDRLTIIDGVANIYVGGQRDYAMHISLDRRKLAVRQLTVGDVEAALRAENLELPAGRIESVRRELSVRVNRIYAAPEDFAQLVVRRGDDHHLVRLGEVATIWLGAEDDKNFFRREGKPMIGLGVVKQAQANTVEVAHRVNEAIAELNKMLPEGTQIQDSFDSSVYIDSAISEVYKTLGIAMALVILVIYLFLGEARATLVPALAVPISLIAAFIFVYAMGFSINLLTLLSLVLAIGLVVDDSIVVLENIHRRIAAGEPPLLAAYRGARQVGFAVVATTLVLIAVFVPLVFLQGNVGRLFSEFALTIAAAVGFSSFVALTLSPVVCSKVLGRPAEAKAGNGFERFFSRLEALYLAALKKFVAVPVASFAILLGCVAATAMLIDIVPGEFAPEEDTGNMFMTFRGPDGSNYAQTSKTVLEIEDQLMAQFDELEMSRLLVKVPSFLSNAQNNTGIAIVGLTDWRQRELSAAQVRERIYGLLRQVPGGKAYIFTPSALYSGGGGQPVQIVVGADTYQELGRWRELLLEKLAGNPVLRNVDIDYTVSGQQLQVKVDRDRAAELGVSVAALGRTLETLLGSRKVTTVGLRGEEYDVVLEGEDFDFSSPEDIRQVYMRSRDGELVALANLVTLEEAAVSLELPRYNRRRALTLGADVAPGYTIEKAIEEVAAIVEEQLPASATIDYKGQSLEYVRTGYSVVFVFAVAILVSFLVMAAQFESFLHPLLILLMAPTAAAGALLGLYLSGQTLNIFSQIGLVMLIGLAAKNGILIVEFANQLRDQGKPFEEALFTAASQRLRPILMTSLTTLFGAVPLLLAIGAGAEIRYVLGVVIFFGVLVATLLTLFVLPALYLKLARRSSTPGVIAARMQQLEEQELR